MKNILIWESASVVRHAECRLFRALRARFTFSGISLALAVQINGFGALSEIPCNHLQRRRTTERQWRGDDDDNHDIRRIVTDG